MNRCKWCGKPIRKFLFGWIHVKDGPTPIGVPENLHVASPVNRLNR